MKLYAKTTSERASKGQGGNEYLNIELLVRDDERGTNDSVSRVEIITQSGGAIFMRFISLVDGQTLHISLPTRYNLKGKNQKGNN